MRTVKSHIITTTLGVFLSLSVAMPAAATPPAGKGKSFLETPVLIQEFVPEENRLLPRLAQQKISYSHAKSIAMSRYPGAQYLDAYLNGNTYTVVLRLPNTKKIKVKIDALSGRIR